MACRLKAEVEAVLNLDGTRIRPRRCCCHGLGSETSVAELASVVNVTG